MVRLLSYDYIYLIPLTISSIFSLRSFSLRWERSFRILSLFLVATVTVEAFAILWKLELYKTEHWSYSFSNIWIYNAFITARHLVLLVFFYGILKSDRIRKAIRWSALPFLIFSVFNYGFMQTPHQVNTYTMVLANTITIVLVLAFFRQVLNDSVIIRLSSSTEIWISLGTFIYYSGTLPFFIFFNYLVKENSPLLLSFLYINDILNLIMYTFYLIAFLCKPQFQK
jgi:hypothetical protein